MTVVTSARDTTVFVALVIFVVVFQSNIPVHDCEELCSATPRTIMQSFIGECTNASNGALCNQAWNTFRDAVIGQPYGNIPPSNYRALVNVFPIAGVNQTLFGLEENTRISGPGQVDVELLEVLSSVETLGTSFVSTNNAPLARIGQAISGSAVNTSWCSNTSLDLNSTDLVRAVPKQFNIQADFIYEGECPCNNSENFWVEFQSRLSSSARGTVTYVTDGEKPGGAYRSDSFFSEYVIPNLNRPSAPRIVVLVVHRTGMGESCSQSCGSLQTLREELQEKSLPFNCYDINGQVRSTSSRSRLAACLADLIKAIQSGKQVNTNIATCRNILAGVGYKPSASLTLVSFLLTISTSISNYAS